MSKHFYHEELGLHTETPFRNFFSSMSLPYELNDEVVRNLGWLPVVREPRPEDDEVQSFVPYNRVSGENYVFGWAPVPHTQEKLDSIAKSKVKKANAREVKEDLQVQNFLDKTPAQMNQYIENQVLDIESAKKIMKLMGRVLLVIARNVNE
jgi:hypothetical protein